MDFYADYTQLYTDFNPPTDKSTVISKVESSLNDISCFINLKFLKLNIDKNNVIFIENQRF